MSKEELKFEAVAKALKNFENLKKCIQGIYEILNISLPSDDAYFLMAQDNLEELYRNFLELLLNEKGARELSNMIKRSEIDLDIVLNSVNE
ncbi:MAG: hypothetical protein ACTSO4_15475 [Promethearchaeota archaeon]